MSGLSHARQVEDERRAVIQLTRDALRHMVDVEGAKLDEVFGYVLWPADQDKEALITVIRVDKAEAFLDAASEHPQAGYLAKVLPYVTADPSQGKLRTMFHLEACGIFSVAVQLYPGASA